MTSTRPLCHPVPDKFAAKRQESGANVARVARNRANDVILAGTRLAAEVEISRFISEEEQAVHLQSPSTSRVAKLN
jgi:hypothetical protein